jgi:hypothetical protein
LLEATESSFKISLSEYTKAFFLKQKVQRSWVLSYVIGLGWKLQEVYAVLLAKQYHLDTVKEGQSDTLKLW